MCALYRSTTYAGERHAAFRKMERLAKAAGLTLEQATDLAIDGRSGSLRRSKAAEAAPSRSFGLVYRTAAQEKSRRIVDLLGISRGHGHPGYLRCFCHLRREFRSFRIDRVLIIFDPGTVQVLADDPSSAWVRVQLNTV